MPGTRTAPTVDGTFTFVKVSISLMDWTGDIRTDTYQFDAGSTNAQIETFVAATQAISNSTIYAVEVRQTYNSQPEQTNALEEVWENAQDNLTILAKNALNVGFNTFVPAPINAIFIENTEEIDPTNTALLAYLTSITPMKAGYNLISARLSHRKQIGKAVKL